MLAGDKDPYGGTRRTPQLFVRSPFRCHSLNSRQTVNIVTFASLASSSFLILSSIPSATLCLISLLLSGQVPHEWREYKRLLRHVGLGSLWPVPEKGIDRENKYVMRYYNYLDRFARFS